MAFWGVQVKPGIPFTHQPSTSGGRVHLSQATLGIGSASMKCTLQCTVRNKYPVFLCSLAPERNECCQLNVEFDEDQPVVFSVIGPRSIHITGHYLRNISRPDDESESYGEDIAMTESDRSLSSDDYDYGDSFIDDCDDHLVVPETSSDEERPRVSQPKFRRLKKKYQSPEKENTTAPSNGNVGKKESESDSDVVVDDFFISLKKKDMKEADHKNCEEMDNKNKEEEAAGDVSLRPTTESVSPKKKRKKRLKEAGLEASGECGGEPNGLYKKKKKLLKMADLEASREFGEQQRSCKKKKKNKKGKTSRMLEFELGSDSSQGGKY